MNKYICVVNFTDGSQHYFSGLMPEVIMFLASEHFTGPVNISCVEINRIVSEYQNDFLKATVADSGTVYVTV